MIIIISIIMVLVVVVTSSVFAVMVAALDVSRLHRQHSNGDNGMTSGSSKTVRGRTLVFQELQVDVLWEVACSNQCIAMCLKVLAAVGCQTSELGGTGGCLICCPIQHITHPQGMLCGMHVCMKSSAQPLSHTLTGMRCTN